MCTGDRARYPPLVKLLNGSAKGVALQKSDQHEFASMSDEPKGTVPLAVFKGDFRDMH